jgi:prepilin-type N-terminal cleavage/methylation domain-containing protein
MRIGGEDTVTGRDADSRCQSGFTLVELVVVIAIISVLLAISTLYFNQWMRNKNAEAEVRQISTDINELRVRAMTTKNRHSITINTSRYSFQNYSTDDLSKCTGGTPYGKTTNVTFKLKKNATDYYVGSCSDVGGDTFEIDQRGMLVGSTGSIFLDYGGSASLDCLILDTVRVNVGKTDATGAKCNAQ